MLTTNEQKAFLKNQWSLPIDNTLVRIARKTNEGFGVFKSCDCFTRRLYGITQHISSVLLYRALNKVQAKAYYFSLNSVTKK